MKIKGEIDARGVDTIKVGKLCREMKLDATVIERQEGEEQDMRVELAFSSEFPVRQFFGNEVLDHSPESVRLGRLRENGPLLFGHDSRSHGALLGVVESARIDPDRVGRAIVRFDSNNPQAETAFRQVQDGILRSVSVGYQVHRFTEDDDEFRATDWEPFELSLVSVPADPSVGVGRSQQDEVHDVPVTRLEKPMSEDTQTPTVDVEGERKKLRAAEVDRMEFIRATGQMAGFEADEITRHINDGTGKTEFQSLALKRALEKKASYTPPARDPEPDPKIGLTEGEVRQFSITRLVRAELAMRGQLDPKYLREAAFEIEACQAAVEQDKSDGSGRGKRIPRQDAWVRIQNPDGSHRVMPLSETPMKDRESFAIPHDIVTGRGWTWTGSQRTLQAGVATGDQLVPTDLSSDLIDVLRKATNVGQLGATFLPGLSGDFAYPRKTAGSVADWLATETTDSPKSEPTFDQVPLTPHTLGVHSEYSRQLILQSVVAVEPMIRTDHADGFAVEMDRASLYGSGAGGEPLGLSGTTGVQNPPIAAGSVPDWTEVTGIVGAIDGANALFGSLGWNLNPTNAAELAATAKAAGTSDFIYSYDMGGMMSGYPALRSSNVTAKDYFFGAWQNLVIGMWGGMDVLVDPYTNSASGVVRVVSFQSMDIGIRQPTAFAFSQQT